MFEMTESQYQAYLARQAHAPAKRRPSKAHRSVPESCLLAHVRTEAARNGWMVYHTHNSRRSEPGFPDIVAVRPHVVLFTELKSESGKLSAEQAMWGDLLSRATRVDYRVWRPSDMDEATHYLWGEA